MSVASTDIDNLAVDTIRTLSMDAVQTANSGHPGTPMALGPDRLSAVQPDDEVRSGPAALARRDRFVLSCGHASMLLYSVLHLAGVKAVDDSGQPTDELAITLEAIKKFRQIGSPCAGHPEYGEAAGIETTTGPLGAGVGNTVGMAMAQKWLAANYNTPDHDLFDYNVYAVCSDGDLMEGVASEAASLAGHLKLDNLCWIYDDNHITIEGDTELAFSEDVGQRFKGLGWNVSAGRRRQRPAGARQGDRRTSKPATTSRRSSLSAASSLGRAEQTEHARRPRCTARLGRNPPDEGELWLSRGRKVLRSRGCPRALRNGDVGDAGGRAYASLERNLERVPGR